MVIHTVVEKNIKFFFLFNFLNIRRFILSWILWSVQWRKENYLLLLLFCFIKIHKLIVLLIKVCQELVFKYHLRGIFSSQVYEQHRVYTCLIIEEKIIILSIFITWTYLKNFIIMNMIIIIILMCIMNNTIVFLSKDYYVWICDGIQYLLWQWNMQHKGTSPKVN